MAAISVALDKKAEQKADNMTAIDKMRDEIESLVKSGKYKEAIEVRSKMIEEMKKLPDDLSVRFHREMILRSYGIPEKDIEFLLREDNRSNPRYSGLEYDTEAKLVMEDAANDQIARVFGYEESPDIDSLINVDGEFFDLMHEFDWSVFNKLIRLYPAGHPFRILFQRIYLYTYNEIQKCWNREVKRCGEDHLLR